MTAQPGTGPYPALPDPACSRAAGPSGRFTCPAPAAAVLALAVALAAGGIPPARGQPVRPPAGGRAADGSGRPGLPAPDSHALALVHCAAAATVLLLCALGRAARTPATPQPDHDGESPPRDAQHGRAYDPSSRALCAEPATGPAGRIPAPAGPDPRGGPRVRVRFTRRTLLTLRPPGRQGFLPAGADRGHVVEGWVSGGSALTVERSNGSPLTAELPPGGWELADDPAARPERLHHLKDGPAGPDPADPGRCLFRQPDEAAFWRAILAAPGDDLPRLVYADWLDEHDDPHAWVFRDPRPFTAPDGQRLGWATAAAAVGGWVVEARPSWWQCLGPPDAASRLGLVLADGTCPPPFAAHLLVALRVRAAVTAAFAEVCREFGGQADRDPDGRAGVRVAGYRAWYQADGYYVTDGRTTWGGLTAGEVRRTLFERGIPAGPAPAG